MQTILNQLHEQHLIRKRYMITEKKQATVVINRKQLINFCSNDYLNLTDHPTVKHAFAHGVTRHGAGSGSSSVVSGYTQAHARLEQAFADFLQRERALLFNSGYHANLGVVSALANRHSIIIADKYIHASLIDGIRLSRARHYRYQHNNMTHAAALAQMNAGKRIFFITESVFSMHGDIANISTLAALSKHHQALLIVDDAHGFGVLGIKGRGITEAMDSPASQLPCLITPLGKATANVGAIVSGDRTLIEVLMQSARTYRYSTALPPALCHASLQALKLIQTEPWRREKLIHLVKFFIQQAKKYQLPLMSTDITPIKSIIIGDNKKTFQLHETLLAKGFFVACIRPPTVPLGQACLRISLTTQHEEKHILALLEQITIYLEQHA